MSNASVANKQFWGEVPGNVLSKFRPGTLLRFQYPDAIISSDRPFVDYTYWDGRSIFNSGTPFYLLGMFRVGLRKRTLTRNGISQSRHPWVLSLRPVDKSWSGLSYGFLKFRFNSDDDTFQKACPEVIRVCSFNNFFPSLGQRALVYIEGDKVYATIRGIKFDLPEDPNPILLPQRPNPMVCVRRNGRDEWLSIRGLNKSHLLLSPPIQVLTPNTESFYLVR